MARPNAQLPTLRFHKSSGQFYYWFAGKRHYLGAKKGVAEQHYRLILGGAATPAPDPAAVAGGTLAEAMAIYREFAGRRYTDYRAIARVDAAIDAALAVHAILPIESFRPRHLRDIRDGLVQRKPPLSRSYINCLIRALKTALRWLAEEEHVQPTVLAAARTVRALAPGEGGREISPVPSVENWIVDATRSECSPTIRAMVDVQKLTGMRPGELCAMRRGEVSMTPAELLHPIASRRPLAALQIDGELVWIYVPSQHKNTKRGRLRAIAIGPAAQKVLLPLLTNTETQGYVFKPAADLSPAECQALKVGDCFTVRAYHNAIKRAAERANRRRREAFDRKLIPELKLVPSWSPNQLRHAALEGVADQRGAEDAAAMAGHSPSRRALDAYVQNEIMRSARAARMMG